MRYDSMMTDRTPKKSLMRNLGEFVGHIVKGAKTNPSKSKHIVCKDVEEQQREDGITLRRTTIEEIEIRNDSNGDER